MSKPGAIDDDDEGGIGFFDLEEFPAFPVFIIPFFGGIKLVKEKDGKCVPNLIQVTWKCLPQNTVILDHSFSYLLKISLSTFSLDSSLKLGWHVQ